jgi:hypothetical protein
VGRYYHRNTNFSPRYHHRKAHLESLS